MVMKLVPFIECKQNWEVDDKLEIFLRGDFANGSLIYLHHILMMERWMEIFNLLELELTTILFDHHF